MRLLPPDPKHYTLGKDWKYVASNKTDIRKTFKRIREQLAAEAALKPNKVKEFKRERTSAR